MTDKTPPTAHAEITAPISADLRRIDDAGAKSASITLMTEDRACTWAWDQVREDVGTKGWTAGDSCNFYGFFLWGWNYRGQYEAQRPAAPPAPAAVAVPDERDAEIAGLTASVGHLSALVDGQQATILRAKAAMTALHNSASLIDESRGDLDARIPEADFRQFVDEHAALMHAIAQSPVAAAPAQEHATQLAGQGQFQQRVQPWLLQCFGADIAGDKAERNHRFLEEALELVQACGCTASEAHQLVDYVFGRPVGEPAQEVGGVMVTLAALCYANCLDMHATGETELERISVPAMMAKIKAKQAAKPKHSPLPAAPAQAQEDAPALEAPAAPAGVYTAETLEGKQHDTGRVKRNGGFFAETASPEHAQAIADAMNAALAAAPQAPASPVTPADAMAALKAFFTANPKHAWSWHCGAWACAYDEGLDTGAAHRAAARLMHMAFGCDTSKHPYFRDEHRTAAPAAPALDALTQAARDVLAERARQVERKGYDPEHDDSHVLGEIGALAALYLMPEGARSWDASSTGYGDTLSEALLPSGWSLPAMGGDCRADAVKGVACGLAEIERLDRAAARAAQGGA